MGTINHPLFGEIDPEEEELWEATIKHNGREVEVDLNIEEEEVDPAAIIQTLKCLDTLDQLEKRAREEFRKNHDSGEELPVKGYISHHNETLKLSLNIDSLQDKCVLSRVGLYPDNEKNEFGGAHDIVLDFTIGEDLTDYLLVAFFSREGQLLSIDMES